MNVHSVQVLSGGAQGGVCIWEVHQQKLLARQRLDTGPSAVGKHALPQSPLFYSAKAMPRSTMECNVGTQDVSSCVQHPSCKQESD